MFPSLSHVLSHFLIPAPARHVPVGPGPLIGCCVVNHHLTSTEPPLQDLNDLALSPSRAVDARFCHRMRFSVTCENLIITTYRNNWSLNPYKAELDRSDDHIMGLRSCLQTWRNNVTTCFLYVISYKKTSLHGIDAIRGFSHVISLG
jgi:hypothetical protein